MFTILNLFYLVLFAGASYVAGKAFANLFEHITRDKQPQYKLAPEDHPAIVYNAPGCGAPEKNWAKEALEAHYERMHGLLAGLTSESANEFRARLEEKLPRLKDRVLKDGRTPEELVLDINKDYGKFGSKYYPMDHLTPEQINKTASFIREDLRNHHTSDTLRQIMGEGAVPENDASWIDYHVNNLIPPNVPLLVMLITGHVHAAVFRKSVQHFPEGTIHSQELMLDLNEVGEYSHGTGLNNVLKWKRA